MHPDLPLPSGHGRLRPWRADDAAALAHHANEYGVWLNLRDAFPHPYTLADAESWIAAMLEFEPPRVLAIEVEGEAAGSIGIKPGTDVERVGAEIGYFLGRAHWGRGVMSEALALATAHFLEAFALERLFALPYANNAASARVLEKAGYVLEGRLRRSAIKEGVVLDQLLYAYVPRAEAER